MAGGWLASMVLAVVLTVWAIDNSIEPPADPLESAPAPIYVVKEGTVGRTLPFVAQATWETTPLARNAAAGVVTEIDVAPGETVDAGDILFRVDNRPVVVGLGATPAYRDFSQGASGPDVAQLQRLLRRLGLYRAPVDGRFGPSTRTAVQEWQRAIGVADDGDVRIGDIVWIESLPSAVALGDQVSLGNRLNGGEDAVLGVPESPSFLISIDSSQRGLVPLSAPVEIEWKDRTWRARITEALDQPQGNGLNLLLAPSLGMSICGDACEAAVPLGDVASFVARIVVVPDTTGPLVPVSAISTMPDGSTRLTEANGEQIPVSIRAAANGLAVVDGVNVGTEVVLLAGDSEG